MKTIRLPYHKGHIELELEEKYLQAVLVSKAHMYKPEKSEEGLVEEALDNPIGSDKLEELVKNKKNMVIVTSDHTRPVPSRITLPILLRRIRSVNPGIDIKIVISTGTHRATTHEEMILKYGEDVVKNESFIIHNARAKEDMASLGVLDTGLNAEVNKAVLDTELLIAEGFIEPHFFAGFSGGRKSIFPGVASMECVMANHCAEYIGSPYTRTGILENNPIHIEAREMARRANLKFILNVVIDQDKKIIKAFAGHFDEAHTVGCGFAKGLFEVKASPADIVITTNGGYPLDQNIYQAVKSMTAAESTCKKGGVIIDIAACSDGHGGESFYETFRNARSPMEITDQILKRSRTETVSDQWESQVLARILEKYKVILVTDMCEKNIVEDMFLEHAANINEALALARKYKGDDAGITVIPDGVSVIVT
ncbi:MAG: nickel-dependent lactate racemase [Oscillospiraceae bacterium]|jgi:nickel-dependent lactate racemase|nr:nickel-dependent lactate racemase [Oscillospiraceae bacterium]